MKNDTEGLENKDEILSFLMEHSEIVERLVSSVRSMLERPELSPRQISQLGVFLFGLERLPYPTPGISMSLSLDFNLKHERVWLCINLDDDRFSLESGFSNYDPRVGSEQEIRMALEVGQGWCEGDTFDAMLLAETFTERATDSSRTIFITDNKDDPFNNWDLESDPDAWEKLDSDYL